LVVDPDPTHRLLAIRMLQRLGVLADGAGNTDDAIDRAVREPYDAVLLDGDLITSRTSRLAARLRSAAGATADPLLVVMGFTGAEDPWDVQPPPGFDMVTAKPVSITHLRDVLGSVAASRPAQAPAGNGEPPVDHDTLRRLADDLGDAAIVADTVRLYLAELPDRLGLLETGMTDGDAQAVRSTAHSLKSASAMLGAGPLSASCLALERAAAEGRLSRDALREVTARADVAAEALRAYLNS
jgi:HPt (histidine-containing phosphotransfer) domain-containing protein